MKLLRVNLIGLYLEKKIHFEQKNCIKKELKCKFIGTAWAQEKSLGTSASADACNRVLNSNIFFSLGDDFCGEENIIDVGREISTFYSLIIMKAETVQD